MLIRGPISWFVKKWYHFIASIFNVSNVDYVHDVIFQKNQSTSLDADEFLSSSTKKDLLQRMKIFNFPICQWHFRMIWPIKMSFDNLNV